jgi:hypothetical protein
MEAPKTGLVSPQPQGPSGANGRSGDAGCGTILLLLADGDAWLANIEW